MHNIRLASVYFHFTSIGFDMLRFFFQLPSIATPFFLITANSCLWHTSLPDLHFVIFVLQSNIIWINPNKSNKTVYMSLKNICCIFIFIYLRKSKTFDCKVSFNKDYMNYSNYICSFVLNSALWNQTLIVISYRLTKFKLLFLPQIFVFLFR